MKHERSDLKDISIEKVQDSIANARFNDMVTKHHYLKKPRKHGRQFKYFIKKDKRLIGGIQFSDPVWTVYRQFKDYANGEIIENSRFLLLERIQNLGSFVLKESIKLIKNDWQEKTGVIPKLLISYVDIERGFLGTVYKAANFQLFGKSYGKRLNKWGKNRNTSSKLIFTYSI